MTALLARELEIAFAIAERRENPRQRCNLKARVVQCGFDYACVIMNISARGACLISPCRLKESQLLRLDIDGFGGVTGVVRWIAGGETGIEFLTDEVTGKRLDNFLDSMVPLPDEVVTGTC